MWQSRSAKRKEALAVERETLQRWLDAYGKAWMGRDAEVAAELYAEDATFQVTPFDEPIRGRAAIYEYWKGVTSTQERIQFECEIVAVTAECGIARWRASFLIVKPGLDTKLDGVFLITLDGKGKCTSLREWWHKKQ